MLASTPRNGAPKRDNSYFTSTTFSGVSDILDSLVEQTCEVAPPGEYRRASRTRRDAAPDADVENALRSGFALCQVAA